MLTPIQHRTYSDHGRALVRGRGGHRRETARVRIDLEQVQKGVGRHSGLRRLAGEVDLDERRDLEPAGGGLAVKRVDELADLVHDLRLAALEVADEVPAEPVAVGRVLRLEVLRTVLADD